jgi:hypothetical protein
LSRWTPLLTAAVGIGAVFSTLHAPVYAVREEKPIQEEHVVPTPECVGTTPFMPLKGGEKRRRGKRRRAVRSHSRVRVSSTPKRVTIRQSLSCAIRIAGVSMSWLGPLCWIAEAESHDNPRAVGQVENCGAYAEGLMQLMPNTFCAYHMPGYTNVWNATDNALAAIRYIASRYGDPCAIPGIRSSAYRGY